MALLEVLSVELNTEDAPTRTLRNVGLAHAETLPALTFAHILLTGSVTSGGTEQHGTP